MGAGANVGSVNFGLFVHVTCQYIVHLHLIFI